jgi:hypothetical protein
MQVGGTVGQVKTREAFYGRMEVNHLDNAPFIGRNQLEVEYHDNGAADDSANLFERFNLGGSGALNDPTAGTNIVTFNDSFETAEYLGTIRSSQLGRSEVIRLQGTLQKTEDLVDPADYYAVGLMAGQTYTVRVRQNTFGGIIGGDTDEITEELAQPGFSLALGVFDPDGRLIATDYNNAKPAETRQQFFTFTADRPGIYRFAVATVGDAPTFSGEGPIISTVELPYTLTAVGVGDVALGGVVARGTIYDLPELSNASGGNFDVFRGDLGAIKSYASILSEFTTTFANVELGNLRAMDAVDIGALFINDPQIDVPEGSVGLIRATGAALVLNYNTSDTPAIGGDYQLVDGATATVAVNLRANRAIGTIRAADMATPAPQRDRGERRQQRRGRRPRPHRRHRRLRHAGRRRAVDPHQRRRQRPLHPRPRDRVPRPVLRRRRAREHHRRARQERGHRRRLRRPHRHARHRRQHPQPAVRPAVPAGRHPRAHRRRQPRDRLPHPRQRRQRHHRRHQQRRARGQRERWPVRRAEPRRDPRHRRRGPERPVAARRRQPDRATRHPDARPRHHYRHRRRRWWRRRPDAHPHADADPDADARNAAGPARRPPARRHRRRRGRLARRHRDRHRLGHEQRGRRELHRPRRRRRDRLRRTGVPGRTGQRRADRKPDPRRHPQRRRRVSGRTGRPRQHRHDAQHDGRRADGRPVAGGVELVPLAPPAPARQAFPDDRDRRPPAVPGNARGRHDRRRQRADDPRRPGDRQRVRPGLDRRGPAQRRRAGRPRHVRGHQRHHPGQLVHRARAGPVLRAHP